MAPKPIFLQTRGETGLETLIEANQLPETSHFPEIMEWSSLLQAIDLLTESPHDYKVLVVDTVNGAERLCHEHVCAKSFGNDWGEQGFTGYMRGYEVALSDWREFLTKLDNLRLTRRMTVVLLCHTKVKQFKNPLGADYDRFQPDMHDKTWSLTHKWADCVLFGNFSTSVVGRGGAEVADPSKKGKGMGGKQRLLYAVRDAAYDAKNRLGLPEEISMGLTPAEGWKNFLEAVKKGKEVAQ
jgi:AAA domain